MKNIQKADEDIKVLLDVITGVVIYCIIIGNFCLMIAFVYWAANTFKL